MFVKIIERLKTLIKGDFFQNVTVLMSGTAIAQGLAFAASPILSRLYAPSAFGVFGLFTAACSIIAVGACAKYELAILLPEKDEDAANILALSMGIVFFVVIATFFIVLFFRTYIAELLGSPKLAPLLWWAPASIFFTGLYNAFNFWSTRRKKFKRLSISRILQTGGRECTQLGLGFLTNLQGRGLVFGYVLGQACSAGALMTQTYREDYKLIKNSFDVEKIQVLASKHKDFPKYNAPQNILNSISQNVPAILLAFFFNPSVVGLYWFAFRILVAPNKLIGNSIRQVFYQRANEIIQEGKSISRIFLKSTFGLAIIGIIPSILIILFGPSLFDLLFGIQWHQAGVFASWLIIWIFFGFVSSPAIMAIPILGLQKYQFYYELLLTVGRLASILAGGILGSALYSIILYSICGACFNITLISFIYSKT